MTNVNTALMTILIISNIGFIILSLSLGGPKIRQVYHKWKKRRETLSYEVRQREIRLIVDEYLKELMDHDENKEKTI